MTRRRWIADEVSGDRAALVGQQAEHLARVLRVQVGQEFDIVADARVRHGRVISATPNKVEFELGEELPSPQLPEITLVLAIFKFDRMEWAIEKCTELGITRLVPLIAKRSDTCLVQAAEKRAERWRRIGREAAQQARRASTPDIDAPTRVNSVLTLAADRRIVLSEREDEVSLKIAIAGARGAVLAVGPEGGWTSAEESAFREHGWTAASLGATILRVETAAIAAVSIVSAELAEFL
jgi:16S rRNA (uracil1498-N3)-methyltransferase